MAIISLLVSGVLTAWAALEWSNDYFFITRERVLVQKKLLGFFESRQESPFSAILSTGLDTSFFGRALDYGAINLRSYTGNLRFNQLPAADLIYELLENQRNRIERETRHDDQDDMREMLEQRLGGDPVRPAVRQRRTSPEQSSMYQSGSILDLLARFFGLRHAREDGVVYRTHWWILIKKTFLPGLILFGVILIVAAKLLGFMAHISDNLIFIISILATIVSWGWWLYQYFDWHNDIYIITPDQLVDVYRKPLGSEERRSAPVKNIQTVEFKRKGIIGLLLNYGTVRIQIGNEELTFDNVYDPAAIQTEIYANFKHHFEKEKRHDQEKLADWLQVYEQIKEEKGRQNKGDGQKSR